MSLTPAYRYDFLQTLNPIPLVTFESLLLWYPILGYITYFRGRYIMNTKRILTGVTSLLILGTLGLTGCSTNTSTNNEASGVSNSTSKSHTTTHNKNLTSATAALMPQNGSKFLSRTMPNSDISGGPPPDKNGFSPIMHLRQFSAVRIESYDFAFLATRPTRPVSNAIRVHQVEGLPRASFRIPHGGHPCSWLTIL